MKWNNTQIRWLRTVVVISLISFGLLQSPTSVGAYWSEDFDDFGDWVLTAFEMETHDSGLASPEGTPTWEIQDGVLVSNQLDDNFSDIACHNATIDSGYWTINATGLIEIHIKDSWNLSRARQDTGIVVTTRVADQKTWINLIVVYWDSRYQAYQSSKEIELSSGFHQYTIAHNDTLVALLVDGELVTTQSIKFINFRTVDDICLFGVSDWNVGYDSVVVTEGPIDVSIPVAPPTETTTPPPDETSDDPGFLSLAWFGAGLGIMVSSIGIYYSTRYIKKKRLKREYQVNGNLSKKVKQSLRSTFGNNATLYYFLVGLKRSKSSAIDKQLKQIAPPELFEFKFLLQPIRLSIMKLVYKNLKIPAVDIKNQLSLEWVEFSNHKRALETKGYISTGNQVTEDGVQQVVYLEPKGQAEFKRLLKLLNDFIESSEDLEEYMNSFPSTDLYPEN